jgi:hypothetical protein
MDPFFTLRISVQIDAPGNAITIKGRLLLHRQGEGEIRTSGHFNVLRNDVGCVVTFRVVIFRSFVAIDRDRRF